MSEQPSPDEAAQRAECSRKQAQLILADRMAAVGVLTAGVAHEINTPLAVISGNLELALGEISSLLGAFGELRGDDGASAAIGTRLREIEELLRDASAAGASACRTVRDLRSFCRADDDELAPIDVTLVLESSLRIAHGEIRHRASLCRQYGEVALVQGNAARLGQVFLNLIVNAAQAIPEGHGAENEIRITTRNLDAGRVMIEVRDTGSGIGPREKARLFEPFFTTKPPGVGMGLGLAICKRIVSGLGGSIEVESEVGKGTAFRVILPTAKTAASRERRSCPPSAH
jgi:signal transduction histidine kinase